MKKGKKIYSIKKMYSPSIYLRDRQCCIASHWRARPPSAACRGMQISGIRLVGFTS